MACSHPSGSGPVTQKEAIHSSSGLSLLKKLAKLKGKKEIPINLHKTQHMKLIVGVSLVVVTVWAIEKVGVLQ